VAEDEKVVKGTLDVLTRIDLRGYGFVDERTVLGEECVFDAGFLRQDAYEKYKQEVDALYALGVPSNPT